MTMPGKIPKIAITNGETTEKRREAARKAALARWEKRKGQLKSEAECHAVRVRLSSARRNPHSLHEESTPAQPDYVRQRTE